MSSMTQSAILISTLLMLLAATTASAEDPVAIRIYNDDADNVFVTVFDMNAPPPLVVIGNQRINGFSWISVSVAAGAVGNGHVKWIARTADASFRRCGSHEMHGVANDSFVYVSTNSRCRKS